MFIGGSHSIQFHLEYKLQHIWMGDSGSLTLAACVFHYNLCFNFILNHVKNDGETIEFDITYCTEPFGRGIGFCGLVVVLAWHPLLGGSGKGLQIRICRIQFPNFHQIQHIEHTKWENEPMSADHQALIPESMSWWHLTNNAHPLNLRDRGECFAPHLCIWSWNAECHKLLMKMQTFDLRLRIVRCYTESATWPLFFDERSLI